MRRLGVVMLALAVPVLGLALGAGAPAVAQPTTMTFEKVAPESAAALEIRTGRAGASRVKVTVATDGSGGGDSVVITEQIVRSGDMTRIGDDIHVKRHEVVHGDVVTVLGGDVIVDGTVQGDVVAAMGGDVYLNATARVDGDVVCMGGELHEEPGAFVSGKKVTGRGGNIRVGPRLFGGRAWERDAEAYGFWSGVRVAKAIVRFLLAIGLTLLVAWLFQGRIAAGARTMRRQPGLSFGVGALVLALTIPSVIALAVVMVLLAITLIGIPLAVAAALGYALFYVVFALFGLTIGAAVVGEWLAARRGGGPMPVWRYALFGVLLLAGIQFVGRLFEVVGVFGFHGLGTLLSVLAATAGAVLALIGGGAWLKWEFTEGLFGQWRGRWQGRNGRTVTAAAPAGPAPPPPPPPPADQPAAGPPVDPTPGT